MRPLVVGAVRLAAEHAAAPGQRLVAWQVHAALRADERRFLKVVALDQALMTLPVASPATWSHLRPATDL